MPKTMTTIRGEPLTLWARTPNEACALAELAAESAGVPLSAVHIEADAQEIGALATIAPVKYLTTDGVDDKVRHDPEVTTAELAKQTARLAVAVGDTKHILATLAVLHIIDLEELEFPDLDLGELELEELKEALPHTRRARKVAGAQAAKDAALEEMSKALWRFVAVQDPGPVRDSFTAFLSTLEADKRPPMPPLEDPPGLPQKLVNHSRYFRGAARIGDIIHHLPNLELYELLEGIRLVCLADGEEIIEALQDIGGRHGFEEEFDQVVELRMSGWKKERPKEEPRTPAPLEVDPRALGFGETVLENFGEATTAEYQELLELLDPGEGGNDLGRFLAGQLRNLF